MRRFALLLLFFPALIIGSLAASGQTARYDMSVRILPDVRRLEVTGTVLLPAAPESRSQIEFYLSPKMERPEVRLLEPKGLAPLTLLSNKEEGGDVKWIFKTGEIIPAGQQILLQFSYHSENKTAPQFNIDPQGSFAGGGGELWYPQTAFKNRETGKLRFQVPAGETVIATGGLQSSESQQARGEFVFSVTQPSKFAFASGRYTVVKRKGLVPFRLYLLRPRTVSRFILDNGAQALYFLTSLFGKFPYREFSLVEVKFPTTVRGTGEYGFIFANSPEMDKFELSYWAHEIGHQWWGNLVRSQSGATGQMMLSEGITQFGSLLAVEEIEGREAAARLRRNSYQEYFQLVRSGKDLSLTAYVPKNQNETLLMHRLANTKGFILLDMLSRRIGRQRFAAILRKFIGGKTNQLTSWKELRQAIEAGAGQNIGWFFDQWFEAVGAPDYQLSWKKAGEFLRVEITQPAPYFRAALEVEIVGSGRRLLKRVEVVNGRSEYNWKIPFTVEAVTLDPEYKVLRWLPEFQM